MGYQPYVPVATTNQPFPNANQIPLPNVVLQQNVVTREQMLSYSASWYQFYDLVRRFRAIVNAEVLVQIIEVKQAEVAKVRFEQWTVVKLLIYLAIKTLQYLLGLANTPTDTLMQTPMRT